ncbi:MAG: hypothetical protein KDD82_06720 [Planctomycetes bacterium]|nr:hypothetical protein [Planctomycetota bacterium]
MNCVLKGISLGVIVALSAGSVWAQDEEGDGEGEGENLEQQVDREVCEQIKRSNEKVWYLDFKQGKLSRLQIKDETRTVEQYWYLPYTITNRDEVPHSFFINVVAHSDRNRHRHPIDAEQDDYFVIPPSSAFNENETSTSSKETDRRRLRSYTHRYHDLHIDDVFESVKLALRPWTRGKKLYNQKDLNSPPEGETNEQPKIEDKTTGDTAQIALPTIQPGETWHCVAVFKNFDDQMDGLSIFVSGLTNSSLLSHRDYVAPPDTHDRILTEAVLVLTYKRPGSEFDAATQRIEFVGRRWIDQQRQIRADLEQPNPETDELNPVNRRNKLR